MAQGKKNAERLGAHIVFIDESGFLLTPSVCKTWAPRGKTPIVRHRQSRLRISVISALSVSPVRRRLNLFFALHERNIRRETVCEFLRDLLRHIRGPLVVLWDNASIHKRGPIGELCARHSRLHIESFPPYAPELNPDEAVWAQAKRTLANGRPDTVDALWGHLVQTLADIQSSQSKLRACIHQSDLPFF